MSSRTTGKQDPAGEYFAGYLIRRTVGIGSTSTVYAATHPRLARTDAVKVLSPRMCGLAEYRRRFRREVDMASSVDHPAVLPVYDSGEWGGIPWMAMTLVDGGTVHDWIGHHKNGPAPEAALGVLTTIGSALDHLHGLGIVHRDVQPRNILVSAGTVRSAYLADFGVARYVDEEAAFLDDYAVHGAIGYTAPERVADDMHSDPRSDQYGLAVTAFRMLTGLSPFAAGSFAAVVAMQMDERITPLSWANPRLSSRAESVIHRALKAAPEHRFRTCGEFVGELVTELGRR